MEMNSTSGVLITYEAHVRTCALARDPIQGGVHGVLQVFRPVLGHRQALPATYNVEMTVQDDLRT